MSSLLTQPPLVLYPKTDRHSALVMCNISFFIDIAIIKVYCINIIFRCWASHHQYISCKEFCVWNSSNVVVYVLYIYEFGHIWYSRDRAVFKKRRGGAFTLYSSSCLPTIFRNHCDFEVPLYCAPYVHYD